MNFLQTIFLSIGLSMDASCVAMTNGLTNVKMKINKILFNTLLFGLFQGLMPMIGYFAGSLFTDFISQIIPWIALILLGFIGGKMLIDGIKNNDEKEERKELTKNVLFVQAIATSIDALTVGVLYVAVPRSEALIAFGVIGIITFLLSFGAIFIGKKFGSTLSNKAAIFGGIILIGIGLKIFVEYLITIF